METIEVKLPDAGAQLVHVLRESQVVETTSEVYRLIEQGGLRCNQEKIIEKKHLIFPDQVLICQLGKRKFVRLITTRE
jgi:tyrosyl-tRNA synthetase